MEDEAGGLDPELTPVWFPAGEVALDICLSARACETEGDSLHCVDAPPDELVYAYLISCRREPEGDSLHCVDARLDELVYAHLISCTEIS